MFKNVNYRTVIDWWTSIQRKIETCVAHVAFFCFLIALVKPFEIRHRNFRGFSQKEICIFNMRRQIIAVATLS